MEGYAIGVVDLEATKNNKQSKEKVETLNRKCIHVLNYDTNLFELQF